MSERGEAQNHRSPGGMIIVVPILVRPLLSRRNADQGLFLQENLPFSVIGRQPTCP